MKIHCFIQTCAGQADGKTDRVTPWAPEKVVLVMISHLHIFSSLCIMVCLPPQVTRGVVCVRGSRGQNCQHRGDLRRLASHQVRVRSLLDRVTYIDPNFSFSTGFLTILIQAGCLSIITFFIKKYRGSFVIAETHLDWQVSFIGRYICKCMYCWTLLLQGNDT